MRKSGWVYRCWVLVLLLLLLGGGWLAVQNPSHSGEWQVQQQKMPTLHQSEPGTYQLGTLRDFRYHSDGRVREARYFSGEYRVQDLERVWLGISHFADYGIAHALMSFEFVDGRHLVASVEARMRPDQSYSPFRGLFRRYHKIIVLGSEEDIIGLRSHVRGERVHLFPLELPEAELQDLFKGLMGDVESLQHSADFYNTLADNCINGLLRHAPAYSAWRNYLDYRVLLPGYADAFAYAKGWLQNGHSLDEWREWGRIDAALNPDLQAFSWQIRQRLNERYALSVRAAHP